MKYSYLLLAFILFSCSNNKKPNPEHADDSTDTITETIEVEPAIEEVVEVPNDASQEADVKKAFIYFVNSINNTDSTNLASTIGLFDDYYVFKGEDKEGNYKRLNKQFKRFQFKFTDLEFKSIEASCNLAYIIASYKKTIIGRETGATPVKERNKVGLFIMKKNTEGEWKLLVQKTDDGYAHWFYMPEEK